jgi:hypothetical protein
MGVGDQRHTPVALLSGKRPITHFIGDFRVQITGLDVFGIFASTGILSSDLVPLISRYIDWDIPGRKKKVT